MKALHVPFCFYPDPVGGTEVYVKMLGRCLQNLDVDVVIAAPADTDSMYAYDGLPVRRYALDPEIADVSAIYGAGDPVAAQNFGRILDEEKPDIVHLHAFTSGVSLRLVDEAKRRQLPVIFTYHTPTVSCVRGTLLRWGSEVCDGRLDHKLCTRCKLHGLGVNKLVSYLLSLLPPSLSESMMGRRGSVWTGLRMSGLVKLRHESIMALMNKVDTIVVLCNWTKELLLRNNVPEGKIVLSRHGLADIETFANLPHTTDADRATLRLIYLGRIDPVKGLETIIQALQSIPSAPIELDIYGTLQTGNEAYLDSLTTLIDGDQRILFMKPIARDQLGITLSRYDFLVVPSQWIETGPLVVLEAFAAGTPVIGSNLGGIAELIEHGKNGLLVEPCSILHWRDALQRLVQQPDLRTRLREGIEPPKTMITVAKEMLQMYTVTLQVI